MAVAGTGVEHVDVLVVGAGISGIGRRTISGPAPGDSIVRLVVVPLESFGGTWWTHRYPGVRSDSDLFTFGYRFKPWLGPPIATVDGDPALPRGGRRGGRAAGSLIRYQHRVTARSGRRSTAGGRST